MSPEDFFRSLREAHASATRVPIEEECARATLARKGRLPPQRRSRVRLVCSSPPPPAVKNVVQHFSVVRSDGKVLRLTHATLACFFDLTVEQACEAMLTTPAIIKRMRCWYGTNSWPRGQLERGTHLTLTLDAVREHRNAVMQWAYASGEVVLYDSLARALRVLAEAVPEPSLSQGALDALDALFDQDPASDPVTDFPFSVPAPLMPEPEPEEQQPLPPGLFPWNAREEPDEDSEFFRSLCERDPNSFELI
jgi:hypothetical protein